MQYLGGKSRIAKPISEILVAAKGERTTYIEPFLGAASVFALTAPHFERSIGGEIVEDLALMWDAVTRGWLPPTEMPEEEWRSLKADTVPSPRRAFAGFACSFGGKWFAGYARQTKGYNYALGGHRSVAKKQKGMRGAEIMHLDYRALTPMMCPGVVVYCDPPYAGTTEYGAAKGFDSAEFWRTAASWSDRGARVFVSEYTAPPGWRTVWEARPAATLAGGTRGKVVERLFVHESAALPSSLSRRMTGATFATLNGANSLADAA